VSDSHSARAFVLFVKVMAIGSGCGASTTWEAPVINGVPRCEIVMCLPGSGGTDSGANPDLEDACEGMAGVVRRCDPRGQCHSLMTDLGEARAALGELGELLSGQSFVDGLGETQPAADACDVRVLGHSWGGADGLTLSGDVLSRMAAPRRVGLAIVLDGYVPFGDRFLDVPTGVARAVSFRHSLSPADDCSSGVPTGPFRGLPMRCPQDAQCDEFDLSLHGTPIDHCGLVTDVLGEVNALLQGSLARDLGRNDAVEVLRR
jgi:hypothetical protein